MFSGLSKLLILNFLFVMILFLVFSRLSSFDFFIMCLLEVLLFYNCERNVIVFDGLIFISILKVL